jgi:Ring finger domain
MNEITAKTGQTTTSCGHTYHLGCFVRWIQNPEHENCPLCRSKVADEEKIAPPCEDESDDESEASSGTTRLSDVADDDEDDGQDYTGVGDGWGYERATFTPDLRIPRFNAESHALWVFRKTFEPLANDQHPTEAATAQPEPKMVHKGPYKSCWDQAALRMRKGHYLSQDIDEQRGYESA